MRTVLTEEYALTETEMLYILKCLKYCRHRFDKHPGSGIHKALEGGDFNVGSYFIKFIEGSKKNV